MTELVLFSGKKVSLTIFCCFFLANYAFADSSQPKHQTFHSNDLQSIFQSLDSLDTMRKNGEKPKESEETPTEKQKETLLYKQDIGSLSSDVIERLKEMEKALAKEFESLSQEQKAFAHYHLAIASLGTIRIKRQEWEENFADGLETPQNREAIHKELAYLLNLVEMNLHKAIELNPEHPGCYLVSGLKEMLWGRILIETNLHKTIELNSDSYLVEEIKEMLWDRIQKAKENFEMSLSLNPNFSDPENGLFPGDATLLIETCNNILNQKTQP